MKGWLNLESVIKTACNTSNQVCQPTFFYRMPTWKCAPEVLVPNKIEQVCSTKQSQRIPNSIQVIVQVCQSMSFVNFLTISPPRHTNRTSKQKDDDPLGWSFLEPKWVFRGSAHCSFQNRRQRRRRQDRNALTGKHFTFTSSTHSMAPGKMLLVLSDFHRFVTDDRCVTQISIILMCYSS